MSKIKELKLQAELKSVEAAEFSKYVKIEELKEEIIKVKKTIEIQKARAEEIKELLKEITGESNG